MVYKIAERGSLDIDLSIENEFGKDEVDSVRRRLEERLRSTFLEKGYAVFDFKFEERPPEVTENMRAFWGGYRIEFKTIRTPEYEKHRLNPRNLRVRATDIGPGNKKAFRIDISKFEYCRNKQPRDFDGYRIYVYTPEMVVFEKLRAICQQLPEYAELMGDTARSARARDFFDICTVLSHFRLELTSGKNESLLRAIFLAKRVPLSLIGRIPSDDVREYHRADFLSLKDTVKPDVDLKDFDHYFDFVVRHCCLPLQPFWKV